ncbi:MAG: DUF4249 family protein [Flavobacteriaceae bacterium]|nr:DUF4249 family protein [Flavobacteriaceae bacterium]
MKRKSYYLIGLAFCFIVVFSCEDVIDIETPSEDPRLIVDALIRVNADEEFTNVTVKVSQTNSFFEALPVASLNQITLINLDTPQMDNEAILFEEEPGVYRRLFPTGSLMNDSYALQIDWQDELFIGFAEFQAAPEINSLTQGDGTFGDEDDTEVIINFTDIPDQENFYLFDFGFNEFLATEDTFYEGQEFEFSYFYDDRLEPDSDVEINIMGMDKDFYDYMNLLIEQSGQQDFGVFATPSVTVRGNMFNGTDIDNLDNFNNLESADNFPLGYFAIVQENTSTIFISDN